MTDERKPSVSGPVERNIRSVARLERKHENDSTGIERFASAVATFAGSKISLLFHFVLLGGWLLINTRQFPSLKPFDPYPFSLLSSVVSCEGVLLTVFVLFRQNAAQRRADHFEQLNLQVGLLTEKEVTKALQLLRAVCIKLEISEPLGDAELSEMSQVTSVGYLADRILEEMEPKE